MLQVITDSASNCKEAGAILSQKYKWLSWVPCAAHCLDLFLEKVGKKISRIESMIKLARQVVFFIKNHHKSLAIYKQHTSLPLLIPGATR